MPQSLAQLLVHLVFSTKNRAPLIGDDIRDELHAYSGGIVGHRTGVLLKAGSVANGASLRNSRVNQGPFWDLIAGHFRFSRTYEGILESNLGRKRLGNPVFIIILKAAMELCGFMRNRLL